jgi:hypothetical protein
MTESCSLKKEKEKSVEGFYTNLQFPESKRATHSNSTAQIVGSRDVMGRGNEINRILTNMTNVSGKIKTLNTKQKTLRKKAGNIILSQNDSMVYTKHDNAVIDGSDTPSYLIKQVQTGGVEECKKSCATNKNCGGFSYWSGNGTCTMKEISILPNPPVQRYTKSAMGDVWNGQYNASTKQYLINKGKMRELNRGGVTTVELTPEEKQRLATSFMDTSDFCDGKKIYVDANSEQIKQTVAGEGHCAKACEGDANCDMYLMSDANTCRTYKNVSNVSAFCKSGSGHDYWGNLKKNMTDKIIRYPVTGGSEGFSVIDDTTPLVEGYQAPSRSQIDRDRNRQIPLPPKCSIQIIGKCPAHSNLANTGWFDDNTQRTSNNQGGVASPTSGQCNARKQQWSQDCMTGDNTHVKVFSAHSPEVIPTTPKCNIYVGGDCAAHSDITNTGWFDDATQATSNNKRGITWTNRARCNQRRNEWANDCKKSNKGKKGRNGWTGVWNWYSPSTKYQSRPADPPGQDNWTTYVKDPKSTENTQTDREQHHIQSELDASVREYARNVNELKKYNLDLDTMAEGNSDAMDKAIAEYRANLAIVAENRENKTWIHDKNIVGITNLTRKSRAYIYMLWGVLAVIILILLLRNAM